MTANELLEQLNEDTIIDIMAENGSPVYGEGTTSDGQRYLIFRTICHHRDGSGSKKLYYYCETKTFHCYTCCGTMSVFEFVRKVRGFAEGEFKLCMQYIADKMGISLNSNRFGLRQTTDNKCMSNTYTSGDRLCQSVDSDYDITSINKFYDKTILNYFEEVYYAGWIDEGITIESMKKFNIRWYEYAKHIIIPHYNIDGELVGIRRRSLDPDDAKNKYMPETIENTMYGHALGLNLYGLYENKKAIERTKAAIIVEGEKSVLMSDSFYGEDSIAVATCGFNVSEWQMRVLSDLGVNRVFLGFDKDFDLNKEAIYKLDNNLYADYLHYVNRLNSLSKKLSTYFKVNIILDRNNLLQIKDSPMDRGKEVLDALLAGSQRVEWKQNYG